MIFQFGSSGHPPIQPKEQLFKQTSQATQQNRTNQLISLLGCRIVGLLGHWVVWLKGCGVVGSLGHPPIQSKNQLFNQPRQATQPNQTKQPTNQPINPITRPSQKIEATNLAKQPRTPTNKPKLPTNQNQENYLKLTFFFLKEALREPKLCPGAPKMGAKIDKIVYHICS